jgi:hypothetical protein
LAVRAAEIGNSAGIREEVRVMAKTTKKKAAPKKVAKKATKKSKK